MDEQTDTPSSMWEVGKHTCLARLCPAGRGLSLGLLMAHSKAVTKQLVFGEAGEAHNSLPAADDGRASGRCVGPGGLCFQAASLGAAALTEADMQGSSALMRTEHSACLADGTVESVTWVL